MKPSYFVCVFVVRPFLWYHGQDHMYMSRSNFLQSGPYRGIIVPQTQIVDTVIPLFRLEIFFGNQAYTTM